MPVPMAIEDIVAQGQPPAEAGREIGRSREGRPLVGYEIGTGSIHVSLIGGCHADEPVGPVMLGRLVSHLLSRSDSAPVRSRLRWWIVPHVNPDGAAHNAAWSENTNPLGSGSAYDLASYLRHVVREPPGDDMEYGFPRSANDDGVRPENQAVASFLAGAGAPFVLHGSFHGMGYAAGPWFLIERSWADRTAGMRQRLRERTAALGYQVHDIDRGGEKGFHRIDEGFTSRPDSRAMVAYFKELGDEATAALFRPSSMEYVRSLGGDPLTLVSEMPLFIVPAALYQKGELIRPPELVGLRAAATGPDGTARVEEMAAEIGIQPMPIEDQMRLQLAFLEEALATVLGQL